MLLSPIFLALGAVATSVLNSGGRFAAAALAPIVYNLVIIGAAVLLVPSSGSRGSPSGSSSARSATCSSRSGRWRGSASATRRGSTVAIRRRARHSC